MDDNSIMPSGKHKGKKMTNVPAKYLIWIYDNNKCTDEVKGYIKDNYTDLLQESDLESWSQ